MKTKKTIEYYMSLPYRLEIIPDTVDGGFGARYPELPGCITCSETMDGVIANAIDAKRAWLTAALEDGITIAEPDTSTDLLGVNPSPAQFKLRIPRSLYSSLKDHAETEGISMNQYCMYLLTKNDAVYAR